MNLKNRMISKRIPSNDLKYLCPQYNAHLLPLRKGDEARLFRQGYSDNKYFGYGFRGWNIPEPELTEITDERLVMKIKEQQSYCPTLVKKKFRFLVKYFRQDKLDIDLTGALSQAKADYPNKLEYLARTYVVLNLKNRFYRFAYHPKTDGRLHTILTSLPKEFRKFVTYDGKPLIEVDLKNSVPFFLGALLGHIKNNYCINTMSNWRDYKKSKIRIGDYRVHYMSVKNAVSVDSKELQLFQEKTLSGLYEMFYHDYRNLAHEALDSYANKINGCPFDGSDEQLRKIVKRTLLAMLFAKETQYEEIQEIFGKHFPTILEYTKSVKNYGSNVKGKHKQFSLRMLQLEGEMMLNICARKFNQKYYRKSPIFSLHDCLIVYPEYSRELEDIIKEEFLKYLNVAPKVETELW